MYREVLDFWFGDYREKTAVPTNQLSWFLRSDSFDEAIRARFLSTWKAMSEGGLTDWEESLESRLALILVIDQFSRNLFRNELRSFAHDPRALALTKRTLAEKKDTMLLPFQRTFLYLPLEHSENLEDQKLSVASYQRLQEEVPESLRNHFAEFLQYAKLHHDIVERFGRFPHRNAVLKRETTPEEQEFLKDRLPFY